MAVGYARMETPVGALLLFSVDGSLCGLAFEDRLGGLKNDLNRRFGGQPIEDEADPAGAVSRLAAYFAGELDAIEKLRVDSRGTPFQRDVWSALRRVGAVIEEPAFYPYLSGRDNLEALARAIGGISRAKIAEGARASRPISFVSR